MIKTNFTRMQVLELMEYLDNRKDDEIFDTYQEELDYYVAEKQVNNINYTHSCTELKDKEVQTFEEYLISKGYKLSNTYVWQIDNRDLSNEDIIKQRKQYEYSL